MTDPLSIVHNRTTTAAHDQMKAKEHAEAQRRRAELDKKKAIAKANPHEAKLYNHSLGGVGTHASVVVKVVKKDGIKPEFITCELSMQSDGFLLVLVCPSCIFRHQRRQEDSQITLRSWHRKFELLDYGRNEVWVSPDKDVVVQLAGAVQTVDKQTCPVCHFAFHLEKSLDPKERGVTVLREA
jgi:hypothetical protein